MNPTIWNNNQFMQRKNYEIHFYKDYQFDNVPLHHHDFYELYFFIAGDIELSIEGKTYKPLDSDIILISKTALHKLTVLDKTKPYERYILWISPQFLNEISTSNTDLNTCFYAADSKNNNLIRFSSLDKKMTFESNLQTLYNRFHDDSFGNDIECKSILQKILIDIARHILNSDNIHSSDDQSLIDKILQYVAKNIDKDLTLSIIADDIHISKFYLAHLFKHKMNISLRSYITQKRIVLAKQLISQNIKISTVCQSCGFNDYSSFFRVFKNQVGMTPKEYYHFISK